MPLPLGELIRGSSGIGELQGCEVDEVVVCSKVEVLTAVVVLTVGGARAV
jgi:hypothetical protein